MTQEEYRRYFAQIDEPSKRPKWQAGEIPEDHPDAGGGKMAKGPPVPQRGISTGVPAVACGNGSFQ